MSYGLGIDLGTTYTAAAVFRNGPAQMVELGNRSSVVPSVVALDSDGSLKVGDVALREALAEPGRAAREYKRRFGDPVPILLAGVPYSADALAAIMLRWVVDEISSREGGPPSQVSVAHPANWGPYKLELLSQAIRQADLEGALVVTEPEAAVLYYASQERVDDGSVIAVYDLGGGTFDAAIVQKSSAGVELLGEPEGIERLGGIDFDEAVYRHVLNALGDRVEMPDADDQVAATAFQRLREECVDAKEALSSQTQVSIPVLLPSVQTEVRLTRDEFEHMVRGPLEATISALRRALRLADVEPSELSAVLLVGGSSRIPLVAQLVGTELGRPVAVDAHPKHAVALGAALVAARRGGVQGTPAGAQATPAEVGEAQELEEAGNAAAAAAGTGRSRSGPAVHDSQPVDVESADDETVEQGETPLPVDGPSGVPAQGRADNVGAEAAGMSGLQPRHGGGRRRWAVAAAAVVLAAAAVLGAVALVGNGDGEQPATTEEVASDRSTSDGVGEASSSIQDTPLPVGDVSDCGSNTDVDVRGIDTTDGVIKIGTSLPFSGAAANAGAGLLAGMQIAVDEVNATGGIDGCNVELAWEDDGFDAARMVANIRMLIEQDQVWAFVGNAGSLSVPSTYADIQDAGTPLWGPVSPPDPGIQEVYLLSPSRTELARVCIDHLAEQGAARMAVIAPDNELGDLAIDAAELQAPVHGIELVAVERVELGSEAVEAAVGAVIDTDADAVLATVSPAQTARILEQLFEAGVDSAVCSDGGASDDTVTRAGPEAAQGLMGALQVALPDTDEPLVDHWRQLAETYDGPGSDGDRSFNLQGYSYAVAFFELVDDLDGDYRYGHFHALAEALVDDPIELASLPAVACGPLPDGHSCAARVAIAAFDATNDPDGDGFGSWVTVRDFAAPRDVDGERSTPSPTPTPSSSAGSRGNDASGGETVPDADGDGYSVDDGDCDDADGGVYPGATDIPGDGVDQDCDGADANEVADADTDADGDGYSVDDGDCDDADASRHPGAAEIPLNFVDENCDGVVEAPPIINPELFITPFQLDPRALTPFVVPTPTSTPG